MANYEALTSAIQQAIKTNGNQEITGQVLQTVLLQMVNTLGTGAQFMGEATLTTDPGNPDASVFYIASIKGTYTHFGNLTLYTDEVAALSNATGAWTKTTLFHLQSGAPGWDTSKDPTAPLLATIKAGFGALGAYFWDNFISNSPLKTISSGKLGIASGLSGGNITIYLASNIPVAVTATYAYRSGGNNVVVTIPANGTVKMQISGTSAGSSDNLTFSFDYDIEEDHRCIGAVAVIESSDGGGGQQAPLIISLDSIRSMPSGVGDTKNFPGAYIGCSVPDIIAAVNAGTPVAAKRGTQYYNLSITDTASSKVVAEILLRKSSGTGLFFAKMELTKYATSPNSANVVLTGEVEVGGSGGGSGGGSDIDPSDYYTKTEADKKFATTAEVQPLKTWNSKAQNSILVGMPKSDMDSHNPEDLAVRSADSVSVVMPGLDGNDLSANTQILATIAAATDTQAGVMSAADKAKLDQLGGSGGGSPLVLDLTGVAQDGQEHDNVNVGANFEEILAAIGGNRTIVLEPLESVLFYPTTTETGNGPIRFSGRTVTFVDWIAILSKGTNDGTCKVLFTYTTLPVLSLSVTSITWPTEVEGNVQTTIQVAMPKEKVIAAFQGGMALQVLEGGRQPLQIFQSAGSAAQVYGYLLRYDSSNLGLYEFQANFGSASGGTTELSVTITLLKNL